MDKGRRGGTNGRRRKKNKTSNGWRKIYDQ